MITELVAAFGRQNSVASAATSYALDHGDLEMLFDPERYDEVEQCIQASSFLHLYNELRRRTGFPREAGPPVGSYLDRLFESYGLGVVFPYRLKVSELRRWLNNHFDANTYRTLYELRSLEHRGQFEEEFERRAFALEQQSAVIRTLEQRLVRKEGAWRSLPRTFRIWRRKTRLRVGARARRVVNRLRRL